MTLSKSTMEKSIIGGLLRSLDSKYNENDGNTPNKEISLYMLVWVMVKNDLYIFARNMIWSVSILYISVLYFFVFYQRTGNTWELVLKTIQFGNFSSIQKKLCFFLVFPLISSKKRHKAPKKPNHITEQILNVFEVATISIIIISLFLVFIVSCHEIPNDPRKFMSALMLCAEFFKKSNFSLISPHLHCNNTILSALNCEIEDIDQGRFFYQKEVIVSDCLFNGFCCSNVSEGGVIYISGNLYSMYVNWSVFYNISSIVNGGAIYFSSVSSCLRMICANNCSSTRGHFATISSSGLNQLYYLSMSICSYNTSGFCPIYMMGNNLSLFHTNSSMNNCKRYSGIDIINPSSFECSHCAFSNNNASEAICIHLRSFSVTMSMSYVNIVHSNSPSEFGVAYFDGPGPKQMLYCIFQNNQNTLFCVSDGSLEVSHSFIDHSASLFSTLSSVSTSNNVSYTHMITFQLQFFNSIHCNADIPLPQRSLEETLRRTDYPLQSNAPNSVLTYQHLLLSSVVLIVFVISIIFLRYKFSIPNQADSSTTSSDSVDYLWKSSV